MSIYLQRAQLVDPLAALVVEGASDVRWHDLLVHVWVRVNLQAKNMDVNPVTSARNSEQASQSTPCPPRTHTNNNTRLHFQKTPYFFMWPNMSLWIEKKNKVLQKIKIIFKQLTGDLKPLVHKLTDGSFDLPYSPLMVGASIQSSLY